MEATPLELGTGELGDDVRVDPLYGEVRQLVAAVVGDQADGLGLQGANGALRVGGGLVDVPGVEA